jgi:hypothetical protein
MESWSYKSTAEVVRLCLKTLFKSANFRCDKSDLTISIDHGKGHSRATLNVIPQWQLEDGSWCTDLHIFTLANARCKKDNTDMIRNTFGALLNTELKQIREWGMMYVDEGSEEWGDPLHSTINYSHRLKLCSHRLAPDMGIHVSFLFCVFLEDQS